MESEARFWVASNRRSYLQHELPVSMKLSPFEFEDLIVSGRRGPNDYSIVRYVLYMKYMYLEKKIYSITLFLVLS